MTDDKSAPALGVIFHPTYPPETLADYARRAESAGFDELWLWDDCFLPGALTSAAIALSATRRIKVGIGLMPATVYHPLFAAMEITTLARAFPDRILPGFGHGLGTWMKQIGAAPKSSLTALDETLSTVRRLLNGERVTKHGAHVNMNQVQMKLIPDSVPPLLMGAMGQRTLRLSGRVADGTILPSMSSPAYVRWAQEHVRSGMMQAGRTDHRMVVYLDVKVNQDAEVARSAMRRWIAERLPWADVQLKPLGIEEEVREFVLMHDSDVLAQNIPDAWVDALSAAGTPEQAVDSIQCWMAAGVDSLVLQPLNGDPDCLEEYSRYLMPLLRA